MFAFQGGKADFGAQCGLRERDRDDAVQIVALTLEEGMLLHMQNHIQITRRAPVEATFPVSREANAGSVFHAGGNFRVYGPLTQHPAFPFALGTGIRDHVTRPLASGTGARNAEKTLLVANLAAAVAGTARDRGLARGRTRTSTLLAGLVAPHRDFGFGTEDG